LWGSPRHLSRPAKTAGFEFIIIHNGLAAN
jgi:hypothetical protein